jgi:hypothetical protein
LGERDPDAIDYYYGPDAWVSEVRAHPPSLVEIRNGALALAASTKTDSFLVRQLNAVAARAELLQGKKYNFDHEARIFFNLETPAPPGLDELDSVRQQIAALLSGKRYADFDAQFIIPEGRLRAVMDRALRGCRERTLQYLKLPLDESVSTEYVGNRPWNAYSSYKGLFRSLIRINTDFALTVDRALQLACHEGYPGHHAYNTLVDAQLVRREHRFELMVQPTFSPQSLSSEALATRAAEVAFPGEDRLRFERDVLFPIAGINGENVDLYLRINRLVDQLDGAEIEIARDYIDGKLEWARAASALEEKALMLHTDATLKYLNEYRSYMLTYTLGKKMAGRCWDGLADPERWRLFEKLILGRATLNECAR